MPENTITFQAHIAEFSLELDLPNNLIFFSTFSWSLVTSLPLLRQFWRNAAFLVEKIFIYNPEDFFDSEIFSLFLHRVKRSKKKKKIYAIKRTPDPSLSQGWTSDRINLMNHHQSSSS